MTNYYLKGFKQGFQPEQKTATKVYHAILKRQPDFLKKQVPRSAANKQIERLGLNEGSFLSSEITVKADQIIFSELAKELLFSQKPLTAIRTKPIAVESKKAPVKTTTIEPEEETDYTKGDDEEWLL